MNINSELANLKHNYRNLRQSVLYGLLRAIKHGRNQEETQGLAAKYVMRSAVPMKRRSRIVSELGGDAYKNLADALQSFRPRKHGLYKHHVPALWQITREPSRFTVKDIDQIADLAAYVLMVVRRQYLYIFVRQDMSPEQIVVQTAHATFVAGTRIAKGLTAYNPDYVHFVVLGVQNHRELVNVYDHLNEQGVGKFAFFEGAMNDDMTAFATGIITQDKRYLFRDFELLKIGGSNG
jgi:hypothetical protein